jgi:hypothetical protein
MWQKCPICEGSGINPEIIGTSLTTICSVCNGKKIISTVNGLPPGSGIIKDSGDVRDSGYETQQEYFGK